MGMDEIEVFPIPGFREPVNCLTHLLAACVFTVLSFHLVRRGRGSSTRVISLAIMAFATVFLLSMSAVYHLLWPGSGRNIMRQLDIAGVFVLIAGTMTPLHAILFRGFLRCVPLLFIWSAAAAGITVRTIFAERLPPGAGTAIFLVLGWGGLISCILLWRRHGFSFVKPLLWGGVAYTLGVIVLDTNWPQLIPGIVGAHELWHVAVLIGLGLHWKFVFQFANGPPVADTHEDHLTRTEAAMTKSDQHFRIKERLNLLLKNGTAPLVFRHPKLGESLRVIPLKTSGPRRPDGLKEEIQGNPGFSFAVAEASLEITASRLDTQEIEVVHRVLWEAGMDDWMDYSHFSTRDAREITSSAVLELTFSSAYKAAGVILDVLTSLKIPLEKVDIEG